MATETINEEHIGGDRAQSVAMRAKWPEVDPREGAFEMIDKRLLVVDHSYQRGLSKKRVFEIARAFKWSLFQVLSVNRRPDGTLVVVEGQHRLEAAKLRPELREVPCLVWHWASKAEEAQQFHDLSTMHKNLRAYERHRAALSAGMPEALRIDSECRKAGIALAPNATAVGEANCVIAIRNLIRKHDDDCQFLLAMAGRWAMKSQQPISQHTVRGLGALHAKMPEVLETHASRFADADQASVVACITAVKTELQKGGEKSEAIGILRWLNTHGRRGRQKKVQWPS